MDVLADQAQRLAGLGVQVSVVDRAHMSKDHWGRLERRDQDDFELRLRSDCDADVAAEIMDLAFDDLVWDSVAGIVWYPDLTGPDFRAYHFNDFHGRVIRLLPRSTARPQYWRCAECGHQRGAIRAPGGRLKCSACGQKTQHIRWGDCSQAGSAFEE